MHKKIESTQKSYTYSASQLQKKEKEKNRLVTRPHFNFALNLNKFWKNFFPWIILHKTNTTVLASKKTLILISKLVARKNMWGVRAHKNHDPIIEKKFIYITIQECNGRDSIEEKTSSEKLITSPTNRKDKCSRKPLFYA